MACARRPGFGVYMAKIIDYCQPSPASAQNARLVHTQHFQRLSYVPMLSIMLRQSPSTDVWVPVVARQKPTSDFSHSGVAPPAVADTAPDSARWYTLADPGIHWMCEVGMHGWYSLEMNLQLRSPG